MSLTNKRSGSKSSIKRFSRRAGMSTLAFIAGSVLWMAVLGLLWVVVVQKQASTTSADETSTVDGDKSEDNAVEATQKTVVIGLPSRVLPDFSFPECMGGTVSREGMLGKRWVANFVFTRCAGPCPMMTRDFSDLHRKVAKSNPDFQFVTFSVDSSYDTAEVLKKYAETFRADHARWKFVTGDELAIHDFIRRGFMMYVKPELGDMRKPGFEVAHSNRAVLVNEDGIPVGTFLMPVPEDVVRLRRIIEGKVEFPQPGPALTTSAPDGENPPVKLNLIPADAPEATSEPAATEDPATPTAEMPDVPSPTTKEGSVESSQTNAATPKNGESQTVEPSEPIRDSSTEETAEARNIRIESVLPAWVANLPAINASLNSLCTVLLISGFIAIRMKRRNIHRNLMILAFAVSVVFLACYLTYHEALHQFTGERGRAFLGSPLATIVYRSILIPHVILAVFVPILAIRVFVHAWKERWIEHRRLAKITLPIWLFVSITGVVIYWMLYHWPWRAATA